MANCRKVRLGNFVESAAFYKLDNMVIVSDYNCQQVEGATDNQTCVSNMADRFNAFGAKCVECNGHDIQAIIDACNVEHEGKTFSSSLQDKWYNNDTTS